MARQPAVPSDTSNAAIMARIEGLTGYLDAVAKAAGEGRDVALRLEARLTAENTQAELSKIWARMESNETAQRADLQNAIGRTGRDFTEREAKIIARIDALDAFKAKLEGANSFLGWVSKHAPWLLTAGLAAYTIWWKK